MSKSKKRLLIRLSVVAAIVTLGVFAVIQAKGIFGDEPSTGTGKVEVKPSANTRDDSNPVNKPPSFDGNDHTNNHPYDRSDFPTQPPTTVIRGNDDFVPSDHSPVVSSFDDAPRSNPGPPPANSPFDPGGGYFPAPQLPPSQPPFNKLKPIENAESSRDFAPLTNEQAPLSPLPGREPLPPIRSNSQPFNPAYAQNDLNDASNDRNNAIPQLDNRPENPNQVAPSFGPGPAVVPPQRNFTGNHDLTPIDDGNHRGQNVGDASYLDPPSQFADDATSSQPGPKQLEGTQAPSLTLQKQAPAEIQVGRPTMFQLNVKNVGRVDADGVTVIDRIPDGTRFVDASPQATRTADGSLVWNLGTLKPAGEVTISVQLVPLVEGEIGSVATVSFQSKASVSTICTKPVLKIEHSGPEEILIGQSVSFDIKVTNTGTGVATNVILEEDVPQQLSHPAGSELEYEIGDLRPGESREIRLNLTAKQAGQIENVLLVRGEGNLLAEHRAPIEVIAPELNVTMKGPTRRYLERQATYTVSVENPGTAKATDVELVAFLPKGLKFIGTNNQGQYDPQTHAVYWSLTELPANESGDVELTALPVEMGSQKLRIESRASMDLLAVHEQNVEVDGLAAIFFGVADTADPIEVGTDTVYDVRVVNQGSKTATEIRVFATLPDGLRPIGGDGPTTYRISGQTIEFAPLARLLPKGESVYKIQARGIREGDHRINVQVVTNEVQAPVSKEESTRVYIDR